MANVIEVSINGIDKATGPIGKISKTLGSMIKITTKAAAAAGAAAGAVTAFTTKIASSEDRVAKFAKRIGVTTEELSALEFVADRAGISTTQFDLAVQRMTRRVAEAAQGMGEAQTALRDLGINARDFSQLPLSERMLELNERLGSVTNQSEKLALAFKLFDSEGTAVLQMLDGNNEALREQLQLAEKYGTVISAQAAANAEHFMDVLGELKASIVGASRVIGDMLIPILSGIFKNLAGAIADSKDEILAFAKTAIDNIVTFGVIVGQIFTNVKNGIIKAFSSAEGFDNFLSMAKQAFQGVLDFAIAFLPSLVKAMISYFKVAWQAFFEAGKWAWQSIKSWFGGQEPISLGELLFEQIPKATADARAEMETAFDGLKTTVEAGVADFSSWAVDMLGINVDAAKEMSQQLLDTLSEFGVVREDQRNNELEQHASFLEQLSQYYDDFIVKQKDINYQFAQEFGQIMLSTIDSIGQGVAQTIVRGGKLLDVFKEIMKQVLEATIATLIKVGVQRTVMAKLFSSLNLKNAVVESEKTAAQAAANMFKSQAGAPFPVNLTAPAAAASAYSAAKAFGMQAVAAASGGVAHGGLEYIPRESTFLLDKGERVLSPSQNRDLTSFLSSASGENITIENINVQVLPNATNAEALLSMSSKEMEEVVAGPIIQAINTLSRKGIKPEFAERGEFV